jgi:hypothetical protein
VRLGTSRTARLTAILLASFGAAAALWGQAGGSQQLTSLVTDWSDHHLIYSGTAGNKLTAPYDKDPRSWHQWLRQNGPPPPNTNLPADPIFTDAIFSDAILNAAPLTNASAISSSPLQKFHRDWSMSLGTGATVGAGQFPAKFSFSVTTANCAIATQPDFVVFNTSVLGSSTQATIVAFDNLYSGCTGIVPQTYWAYNTGGTVVTSVTLSYDGSQLAFVQSSAGQAQLVLLKWQASATATSTSPGAITVATASQYPTCSAPCMTTLPFSGGANDTNSSTFLDYADDALYVGDDNGTLHKFTPVFTTGSPAEVTTGGWPVALATGLKLTSPVYDSSTGRVFVGSGYTTTGTQLFAVLAATGAVSGTSSSLGKGAGIATGPIVDSTAGKVYAFIGNDGATACYPTSPCSAVYQFATNFTSGTGTKATVGAGGTFPLYVGDFDNTYYTSSNATGNLYVCGGGFPPPGPTIFRIPVTSGTMSTSSVASAALGLSNTACSPLTEIYNPAAGGTDRMFASVPNGSDATLCSSGGCINDLIMTAWQPLTNYALGQRVIDSSNDLEIVVTPGESGTSPFWDEVCGFESIDSGVTWLNTGFLTPVTPQTWKASSGYSEGSRIIDSNGNYECAIVSGGETGTSPPTWKTNIGGTVYDASEEWRNVGPPPNYVLPESGGTSGVILDNVTQPIFLTGTSEVYFSTLGTGSCGTGNGCAVQASQSALN